MSTGSASETAVAWRVADTASKLVIPAAFGLALLSTTCETVRTATQKSEDTARRPSIEASATNVVLNADRADLTAIAQIRRLASYDDGWKGPESVAATRQAREDAEAFARILFERANVLSPRIGMAADGEISFFWKSPRVVVNLGFFGDGTYSYFAQTPQGDSFSDDAALATQALPEGLLALLTAEA